MDGVKQDWYSVACMLQHVLLALKKQQPTVTTAFLRMTMQGVITAVIYGMLFQQYQKKQVCLLLLR